jgi:hypothetical protein
MVIEKSLTQDEMIKELIGLLKAYQMGEKANDLYETAAYIDGLEHKLNLVMEELVSVKK